MPLLGVELQIGHRSSQAPPREPTPRARRRCSVHRVRSLSRPSLRSNHDLGRYLPEPMVSSNHHCFAAPATSSATRPTTSPIVVSMPACWLYHESTDLAWSRLWPVVLVCNCWWHLSSGALARKTVSRIRSHQVDMFRGPAVCTWVSEQLMLRGMHEDKCILMADMSLGVWRVVLPLPCTFLLFCLFSAKSP